MQSPETQSKRIRNGRAKR